VLTYVKWAFLALSVSSVVYAGVLMLTPQPSIKQVMDAVALQAGTKVIKPDMTEYDGDKLVWRLQADSAQDKENILQLEKPNMHIVMDDGVEVPVQALSGIYHKSENKVHLQDDVQVSYQAWDLSTSSLDYFQAKGELVIPGTFALKQEGILITGKDMRIFQDSGKLKVLQGVKMRIEEAP
jgi:LPS export ABC transporter protein LptC